MGQQGEYHFYVTRTDFVEPMFLHIASQLNRVTGSIPGGEKTAFAWVPFCDLLRAVAEARSRYFLDKATRDRAKMGAPSQHAMQLHPCFATSLRLAVVSPHYLPVPRPKSIRPGFFDTRSLLVHKISQAFPGHGWTVHHKSNKSSPQAIALHALSQHLLVAGGAGHTRGLAARALWACSHHRCPAGLGA